MEAYDGLINWEGVLETYPEEFCQGLKIQVKNNVKLMTVTLPAEKMKELSQFTKQCREENEE